MKNILTIAALCAAGMMGFTSCSDFLDEEPKSILTNVAYPQTQAHAEGMVNRLYRNGVQGRFTDFGSAYHMSFQATAEMLTGYFKNDYEGQEILDKYTRTLTRQEYTMQIASSMDGVWDNCYQAINVANTAIKYIPGISMDEEVRTRLLSEAKFFRGWNYYYLVKTFGDVPFYTEPYELAENMELPRTDKATIYAQIESDLAEAAGNLSTATFAGNAHRITSHAANAVLTDVYMAQGKYADAAKSAKSIISSGHKLATHDNLKEGSAYNKLRQYDDLDEVIYAYEHNNEISTSNWLPTYAFDDPAKNIFDTYSITTRAFGPENVFLNVYEENDLRIQPNQFFHWKYTNPVSGKTWQSKDNMACCWYYYDEEALLNTGRGTKDWNFYRLAEILIDAAECIAQSEGVTAEAAGYLAQVQARANMEGDDAATIASELEGLGKQQFIEACWTERMRELPLEFKLWDQCVRTKKFPVISETTPGEVTYVDLKDGVKNAAGATFKESDFLWPLSVNEMQRNPNLVQNPGYKDK